jgi:hypothetical protein
MYPRTDQYTAVASHINILYFELRRYDLVLKMHPCLSTIWSQNDINRHSQVGIVAAGSGLDDRGWGVRFPAGARNFFLLHRVQNDSGAHPAYPMGTVGPFPGGKAAGT